MMTDNGPKNLEELRRLYNQIREGSHKKRLNSRNLAFLKRMLDEPNETAAKSTSELARENGISISSITRLAQKLGFDGFPGLKEIFRANLKQHKSYYSEQVKRFLQRENSRKTVKPSILEQVIQDEWSNVILMADAFDKTRFAAIIDLIIKSERIHIIGLRGSYPLSHYLGFYLKMIRDRVTLIGQAGHTLAEDLSVLKPGDLLIAISVTPYTKDTVNACQICKQQDIDIIAITDKLSSPLTNETDNYLIAYMGGDYFFSPIAAAVIYIETLLSGVIKKIGVQAIQRLNHTEKILEKLKIEM
jgi:DNA-binding MurR/RpiR family transcriptional regulator